MPTREAIVDSVIPREVEKPIPVRTISTRTTPRTPPSGDQPGTSGGAPVAADPAPAAESVRLSPQLSALARKEQAFRQREQALKQREKDMEEKLAEAEKFNQLKTKLSAKDYSEAEALGLDYEGYTQYLLNKQTGDNPAAVRDKALEEKVSSLEKKIEENTTKQYEATVAEYQKEIAAFVGSTPGYEGLKDPDNQKAILQLILDDFEKEGLETTIEQAAKDVKLFLSEQAKKLSVFLEKPEPVVEEKKQLPPPQKTGLKTLTQQVTTGADTAPLKSLQHMSESERYAEARRRALAKRDAALAAQGKR